MNDYYKEELNYLVERWSPEQIEAYIRDLQKRVENARDQIRALQILLRRKNRNKSSKETGTRGGK